MPRFENLLTGSVLLLCILTYSATSFGQAGPVITPPTIDADKELKLPGTVDDVVVGGNGRYILYLFTQLRKVGVFDVNEAKLTHYISVPDDNCRIAAGMTKLLIAAGDGSTLSRYDLASGKRELTSPLAIDGPPAQLLLGSATEGPALICGNNDRKPPQIVDIKSLKTSPINQVGNFSFRNQPRRISANGKTLTCWSTSGSPSGLQTIVKDGDQWKSRYDHTSVGAILPAADGKKIFTFKGIHSENLHQVGTPAGAGLLVPAVHGSFYLGVPFNDPRRSRSKPAPKKSISVFMLGDVRPLATIPNDTSGFQFEGNIYGRESLTLEKKIVFVPQANLLIRLSTTKDKLLLTPFDVENSLAKSDVDFLFVQSQPAEKIAAGDTFNYQIKALSKSNEFKYSLASAPQGMTVSSSGLVTWSTSKESTPENSIIVSITAQPDQEIFHTFNLKVLGATGGGAASASSGAFDTETNVSVESNALSPTDKERTVKLPETISNLVVGGGGRFLLIHFKNLRKVGLFDLSVAKITKYFPATGDNIVLAAGANHLLLIDQDQGVMTRYNLTTHKRELTKAVPFPGKVTIACMGNNSYGPVMVRWSGTTGTIDRASLGLIDLKTLNKASVTWPKQGFHMVNRDRTLIAASDDGKIFSVSEAGTWRLTGDQVVPIACQSFHDRSHKIPAANGKYFVSHQGVYNDKMVKVKNDQNSAGTIFPAINGHYYIGLEGLSPHMGHHSGNQTQKYSGKLYLFGDSRPIMTIGELPIATNTSNSSAYLNTTSNLMFIPKGKLIACVPPSLDSIYLRYFDIKTSLEESGIDYLIVTSTAPSTAKLGDRYEYQLETLSKKGSVKYTLDSAPEGMKISSTGKISWPVEKNLESSEQNVIVTVSDAAGQEVFHSFSIDVPEITEIAAVKKQEAVEKSEQQRRDEKMAKLRQKLRLMEPDAKQRREKALAQIAGRTERQQGGAGDQASQPKQKAEYKLEKWTDETGEHDMEGKFVEIVDRSAVVLQAKDGSQRTVPLHRLTGKHIYRAVEYDIESKTVAPQPQPATKSPFDPAPATEGVGSVKTSSANAVSDQDLQEIIARVEEMIAHCKKGETDPKAFLRGIVAPSQFERMTREHRVGYLEEQFFKGGFTEEILTSLLSLDFSKAKVGYNGIIQIGRVDKSRTVGFKKENGVWGMMN